MSQEGGTGNRPAHITALGVGLGGSNPIVNGPIINGVGSNTTAVAQVAAAVAANLLGPSPSWMNRGVRPSNFTPVALCNLYHQIFNYETSYRL